MSHARLSKLRLKNFKSYGPEGVEIEFSPLTLLVGRNNSGKSSIIQALLLLKQTLEQVRGNDPLTIHGNVPVPAGDLSELTHGWPEGDDFVGPTIGLEWTSTVDIVEARKRAGHPDLGELAKSGIDWIRDNQRHIDLRTSLEVTFSVRSKRIYAQTLVLESWRATELREVPNPNLILYLNGDGSHVVNWNSSPVGRMLAVEWDHFLPVVSVDRRNAGPRNADRGRANGFLVIYDQPLADLNELLKGLAYLSSARLTPQAIYQPIGGEISDVGISGERAAQVFHSRGRDSFHYLPIAVLNDNEVSQDDMVRQRTLKEAIADIFASLGVPSNFSTQEITNIGFVLRFGKASLFHVGRGLSYLLPIIELGLLGDPLANIDVGEDLSLEGYLERLDSISHIAVEEPESHLHPAVHARLAHYLVSTAMCGRQWLVETHSDHIVRRLRRLATASRSGSKFEKWLCENVTVVEVTQEDGVSRARRTKLTPTGDGSDRWPAEFMDRALDEEDAIYLQRVSKTPPTTIYDGVQIEHRDPGEDVEE